MTCHGAQSQAGPAPPSRHPGDRPPGRLPAGHRLRCRLHAVVLSSRIAGSVERGTLESSRGQRVARRVADSDAGRGTHPVRIAGAGAGTGWRATELRYRGGEGKSPLAITLILPDDLRAFERSLSPDLLAKVQARIRSQAKGQQEVTYTGSGAIDCGEYAYNVQVFLPKFGTDTRAKLNKTLAAMGMRQAFDPLLADFTGITTADQMYIAMVIHQANIDVDEVGTEAAAATAVGVDVGGCTGPSPRMTKVLRFNKPFLYVIRDVETGAILFMGRVVDPTQRS